MSVRRCWSICLRRRESVSAAISDCRLDDVHLLFSRIRLALGMSRVVDVDRGQHHHQQHVGHGGIGHDLIDAETEYLL